MRFEPRHAFRPSRPLDRGDTARGAVDLPPELAFLPAFPGHRAVLRAAAERARRDNVCPARALIANGGVTAHWYYDALAAHLGLDFVVDWPDLAPLTDPAAAHRTGCVRLATTGWLVAPEDGVLRSLLRVRRMDLPHLAITTPAHFASILHFRTQGPISRAASEALPAETPLLSARGAFDPRVGLGAVLAAVGAIAVLHALRLVGDLCGLLFFAGMSFRLLIGAVGLAAEPERQDPHLVETDFLAETDLPIYTILVPLRQEDELVPDLLAALHALDYPRAKLEVLLLVEPEDFATREALAAARLPPWLHVVLGPIGGSLRTKPRALNIGLMMARGTLVTVYDAEDRPEPDQLRRAAAVFATAPETLACVQARLAIDNGDTSLLARLFAIEYAALFDVFNIGMARLGLPMALGGTSNHFRVSTLRVTGGWDAWNVTEDADLGLRLARLGHHVGTLASTTLEAAPDRMPVWMKQRRRWTKGWMQTFLVLARDARQVGRRLGWMRSGALALLLINLVAGPLLFPWFCGFVLYDVWVRGLPDPQGGFATAEATLAGSVFALGIVSTLWCGYAGLRVRRLLRFLPSLPLLVPYQLMISLGAWVGLIDLIRDPYHWHKTTHRPMARTRDRP